MRLQVRMAVMIALLGVAGIGSAVAPAPRLKDDGYPYIKVEMRGRFSLEGPRPNQIPTLVVGSNTFEVQIKWPKGVAAAKEMEKLDGKTLIVQGTLDLRRPPERYLIRVVTFARVAEEDD